MPVLAAYALLSLQAKSNLPAPTEPPLNSDPTISALEKKAGLHFDDLFPRRSFFGRGAAVQEWSPDSTRVLYTWAPYGWRGGNDLYLYDAKTDKTTRLTSPEILTGFDRDTAKAIERYKKDEDEQTKSDAMSDLDWREWRLKQKEENEKRTDPLPAYRGVAFAKFSPDGKTVLFGFDGDLFTVTADGGKPHRLTRTETGESDPTWLPDGSGVVFVRDGAVFRRKFASGDEEQLNPKLDKGVSFSGYDLSPDGRWLMVQGSKGGPPERQVDYISYRDRFAQVKRMTRSVADDDFKGESYLYLYDLSQDSLDGLTGDGKPWEVWKWPGGKEWQQLSLNEHPFSKDSKQFVFGTWKRTAKDQEIVVADLEKKTLKTIYKGKPDGEHTTPGLAQPFFLPDGDVIALLDATGFRQPWKLSPANETANPITQGAYDSYPLQATPDGHAVIISAGKEDPARLDLYKVDVNSGTTVRMTHEDGMYRNPKVSPDGTRATANFSNWSTPSELVLVDSKEKPLTESHRPGAFAKVNTLKPKLFTYKDRKGMDVHGYVFVPQDLKKGEKRPLFLYVYGGPLGTGKSVEEGSFNSTAYLFAEYLTRVFGYVTATIDPRGQSGYGNAFGKANYEAPGVAQVEDLTDGVKYLQATYGIDPAKVGVNGWSFGGFQTQMCMYTAPDVFTLGIAGAGPTEWQNYNNWYSTGVIGPVPNAKPEDLDKYSLTYLAKNLRGPILLLHGMEDDNVMFQDTVKVYRKLLQYGKGPLVELALDPTGNHGMGGDMDTRDRHAIYLSFLNRWWGPYTKP
ncbi:hypothetical protein BH11ARM2_BH11ARM2_35190 [soil metagenome]